MLLRQWLAALLKPYGYMTLPVIGEGGGRDFMAFQLLDIVRKSIIVRPFVSADDLAEMSGLYTAKVQPLEVFRASTVAENLDTVLVMDTFVMSDPCHVDISTACGGASAARKDMVVWQARQSDLEGCIELHSRKPLNHRPVDALSS